MFHGIFGMSLMSWNPWCCLVPLLDFKMFFYTISSWFFLGTTCKTWNLVLEAVILIDFAFYISVVGFNISLSHLPRCFCCSYFPTWANGRAGRFSGPRCSRGFWRFKDFTDSAVEPKKMVLCVQHVELAVFGVRWSKVRQIQVVNTWVATTCSLCDLELWVIACLLAIDPPWYHIVWTWYTKRISVVKRYKRMIKRWEQLEGLNFKRQV